MMSQGTSLLFPPKLEENLTKKKEKQFTGKHTEKIDQQKESICKKMKHLLLLQKDQEDTKMGVTYKSGIKLVLFKNIGMYHAVDIFVEKIDFLVII